MLRAATKDPSFVFVAFVVYNTYMSKIYWSLIGVLIVGCIFIFLQFSSPNIIGNDDTYFHIKYSSLMSKSFDSQESWVNTSWLFHFLLSPFTLIKDLVIAEKLTAILFSIVIFLTINYILVKYNCKLSWVWALLALLGSGDFIYRLLLLRPYLLSIILLLLFTYYISRNSYRLGGLIAVLYGLSYAAAPLVLIVLAVFVVIDFLMKNSIKILNISIVIGGLLIGLILNPEFPQNISHIFIKIIPVLFFTKTDFSLGTELFPYKVNNLIYNNLLILTIWLVALWEFLKNKHWSRNNHEIKQTIGFITLSVLFFLLVLFGGRRFIEYWVPFALISTALVAQPFLVKFNFKGFKETFICYKHFRFALVVFLFAMITPIYLNIRIVYGHAIQSKPTKLFYPVGEWLLKHEMNKQIIFNTQWDNFYMLYFWNARDQYVIGFDPTSLFIDDSDKYFHWSRISADEVNNFQDSHKFWEIISNVFNANYLVIENERNPKLKLLLETDQIVREDFSIVYSDSAVSLYQVR